MKGQQRFIKSNLFSADQDIVFMWLHVLVQGFNPNPPQNGITYAHIKFITKDPCHCISRNKTELHQKTTAAAGMARVD